MNSPKVSNYCPSHTLLASMMFSKRRVSSRRILFALVMALCIADWILLCSRYSSTTSSLAINFTQLQPHYRALGSAAPTYRLHECSNRTFDSPGQLVALFLPSTDQFLEGDDYVVLVNRLLTGTDRCSSFAARAKSCPSTSPRTLNTLRRCLQSQRPGNQ